MKRERKTTMEIRIKVYGKMRTVACYDRNCPKRPCWRPHDCPVQGCGGVRESTPRWMCLTNAMQGCPDPIPNAANDRPEKAEKGLK
jgi:hypothetical protein